MRSGWQHNGKLQIMSENKNNGKKWLFTIISSTVAAVVAAMITTGEWPKVFMLINKDTSVVPESHVASTETVPSSAIQSDEDTVIINGVEYGMGWTKKVSTEEIEIHLVIDDADAAGKTVQILKPNGGIGIILTEAYALPIDFTCPPGIYEIQVFEPNNGGTENVFHRNVEFKQDGTYKVSADG